MSRPVIWTAATLKFVFDIFSEPAHQKNIAVLTVTHDLDFAKPANRFIEMKDGRII